MLKKSIFIVFLFASLKIFGWGVTGHRTVGFVAQQYLSKKASKKLDKILDGESLAVASTWMDEIKSDSTYDYAKPWHWVTIPTGMTYEQAEKNPDGDVVEAIERITAALKKGGLSHQTEVKYVKMLIHLVGDIHQPLHVGTGEDMGGNQVKLKWFWGNSNLHKVWDSEMIDSEKYSYTELGNAVNHASKDEVEAWQQAAIDDWIKESMQLRDQVYDIPEDKNLKYEYRYKNWPTVESRLLKAGVRLAGILNEIYG